MQAAVMLYALLLCFRILIYVRSEMERLPYPDDIIPHIVHKKDVCVVVIDLTSRNIEKLKIKIIGYVDKCTMVELVACKHDLRLQENVNMVRLD